MAIKTVWLRSGACERVNDALILETTFVIDLERETVRGVPSLAIVPCTERSLP